MTFKQLSTEDQTADSDAEDDAEALKKPYATIYQCFIMMDFVTYLKLLDGRESIVLHHYNYFSSDRNRKLHSKVVFLN